MFEISFGGVTLFSDARFIVLKEKNSHQERVHKKDFHLVNHIWKCLKWRKNALIS